MIPLREQEAIRRRFEEELEGRVRIDYFTQRQSKLIIPGRQDCLHCEDVRTMLDEVAHLGTRIALSVHELAGERKLAAELGVDKVPGTAIRGVSNRTVRFSGIPMGAQFPVFIDAVIEASKTATGLKPETVRQLRKLKDDVSVQVFVHPSCPHSPAVSRGAFRLGLHSPHLTVEVIEVAEFPSLAQRLNLRATPTTLIGERLLLPGAIDEAELVQAIFRVAEGKPLSPAEFKTGPGTAIQVAPAGQAQPRPATSPAGIILPR